MACWTVFEERQALSTTFRSDVASSLSSFMAMDSSGVVTSQVARRGRVVVSPPIFSLVLCRRRLLSRWLLLGSSFLTCCRCLSLQKLAVPRSTVSWSSQIRREEACTVLPVLECAPQSWMLACHPPLEPEFARSGAIPPIDIG